jgi:DNA replication protein DnaC
MELRDYQYKLSVEASYKLVHYGMAYLSMEVRTGKTLTSIAAAENYIKAVDNYVGKVLFVTKKKAINDIIEQYMEYNPEAIDTFSVVNYESLHKVEREADELDVLILDEAHSIGAFPKPSKRFKDIRAILNRKTNGSTTVLFLSLFSIQTMDIILQMGRYFC